jgi:hypothetical protein
VTRDDSGHVLPANQGFLEGKGLAAALYPWILTELKYTRLRSLITNYCTLAVIALHIQTTYLASIQFSNVRHLQSCDHHFASLVPARGGARSARYRGVCQAFLTGDPNPEKRASDKLS